jgi:hypothetical protein
MGECTFQHLHIFNISDWKLEVVTVIRLIPLSFESVSARVGIFIPHLLITSDLTTGLKYTPHFALRKAGVITVKMVSDAQE